MTTSPAKKGSARQIAVKLHRWLGIGAAAIWLVQAITGLLLTFHFAAEDAMLSMRHVPSDLAAIEPRIDTLANAGGQAKVDWIWTTDRAEERRRGKEGDRTCRSGWAPNKYTKKTHK